jgi:hypothetical protein
MERPRAWTFTYREQGKRQIVEGEGDERVHKVGTGDHACAPCLREVLDPYKLLDLTRTGSMWTNHEILADHGLRVFFNQIGEDVILRFEYHCSRGLVGFSKKSRRMADESIAVLCNLIKTSKPRDIDPDRICVDCRQGIAEDAKFCTHCGYDLDGRGIA